MNKFIGKLQGHSGTSEVIQVVIQPLRTHAGFMESNADNAFYSDRGNNRKMDCHSLTHHLSTSPVYL